jgi:hypothetical protein
MTLGLRPLVTQTRSPAIGVARLKSRQNSLNRFGASAVAGDRSMSQPALDRPGVMALARGRDSAQFTLPAHPADRAELE